MSEDRAISWRADVDPDLTFMRARFVRHEFPDHFHETYVIEVVEEGGDAFDCRGEAYIARPGDVVVIEPREIHNGHPASGNPLVYRSLYPKADAMKRVAMGLGFSSVPRFDRCVINDPECYRLLLQAHRAAEVQLRSPGYEVLLHQALAKLMLKGTAEKPAERPPRPGCVRRAIQILRERFHEPISLPDLAAECAYSPYHFLRIFRSATGTSPHDYQVSLRVEKAKVLLRKNRPIAEIAANLGFSDQAHLTRHFKRLVGVTPGAYRDG